MNNKIVINQVIILFIMMGTGFYARKRTFITDEGRKTMSDILINITCPLIIISSFKFDFSMELVNNILIVFIFSVISHIVLILLGKILYKRYTGDKKAVLKFITIFSNCAFMGYPLLQALYGKMGIFYGSIFQLAFNVFLWTYGVSLISGKTDRKALKKALVNPGIIAVLIGFSMFLLSIKLPVPIYNAIDMIGAMTVPLSMMIIGSNMADMKLKDGFSKPEVYYVSFIRLIFIPFSTLIILKLIGLSDVVLGTCVIIQAMPAASMVAVIAENHKGDRQFASQCVFITTLLSLVTIPLILIFL